MEKGYTPGKILSRRSSLSQPLYVIIEQIFYWRPGDWVLTKNPYLPYTFLAPVL